MLIVYVLINLYVNLRVKTKKNAAKGNKSNTYLYAPQLPINRPKLIPARKAAIVPPLFIARIKKYRVNTVKRIPTDSLSKKPAVLLETKAGEKAIKKAVNNPVLVLTASFPKKYEAIIVKKP